MKEEMGAEEGMGAAAGAWEGRGWAGATSVEKVVGAAAAGVGRSRGRGAGHRVCAQQPPPARAWCKRAAPSSRTAGIPTNWSYKS